MPVRPRPPRSLAPLAVCTLGGEVGGVGNGFVTSIRRPSAVRCTRRSTGAPPACRIALVSASCTMRYPSRETAVGTESRLGARSLLIFVPAALASSTSRGRSARPRCGAMSLGAAEEFASPARNKPRTWSRSAIAVRPASSIAANARATKAGSVSPTCWAAAACTVVMVRAWPTESCKSRASRLRSARLRACASRAAIRSSGDGPSRIGANLRRPTPAAAVPYGMASSNPMPRTSSHHRSTPSRKPRPEVSTIWVSEPKRCRMKTRAVGTAISSTTAKTPPLSRCTTNQSAERSRVADETAPVGSGTSAPRTSRAAEISSDRTPARKAGVRAINSVTSSSTATQGSSCGSLASTSANEAVSST